VKASRGCPRRYRVGSRDSALAIAQTRLFIETIRSAGCTKEDAEFEIIPMKTSGDALPGRPLARSGGKGLFTKELDRALISGEIDFAVHSLKDVPTDIMGGLELAAFSKREDPRDALVLPASPNVGPVGASSLRRRVQLAKIFPDWPLRDIRGNIVTRLEKLDRGEYGALALAAAGLKRLGLEGRLSRIFGTDEMLPASGQGVIAAIAREGERYDFLVGASCEESRLCALAERAFVRALGAGCSAPIAAFAEIDAGGVLTLRGLFFDGKKELSGAERGDKERAEEIGIKLGKRIGTLQNRITDCNFIGNNVR
jgi:hydroxymethylbilane synthase